MAQFVDYQKFIFNGVHSDMFNVSMVTTDDMKSERIFGLNSTLETQDGVGDTKIFVMRKNNSYNFNVEIMKLSEWNDVLPMSEKDYDDIIRWLMVDEVCPLEVGGLVHYGIFKAGTEFHNTRRQGIIKLEFESICPCAYTPIINSNLRITGERIIELENKSNTNKKVYLDIYIEKTNSAGSVEMLNLKDGSFFKINNLENRERIKILGEGLFSIESLSYPKKNLFNCLEYTSFPCVKYGVNKFKIIGDCNIKITYQLPVALR